ncbi:hypothetical protein MM239_20410 [Belliella sp. DSM 111904]|uniref:YD repeat-containing protein n=1 Tax=Belliella filtrata TaxID=2923435 RepID=A0ABS9V5Q4_9BACT|nr:hypothetical protein [Belliella filtrata]MCH7411761.1 hypothetical protein [Belliella filtrata]
MKSILYILQLFVCLNVFPVDFGGKFRSSITHNAINGAMSNDSTYHFEIKNIIAQNSYNPSIERIIPPSPNAASLAKYGSIPVGLSTGIPSISIPVYDYSYQDKLNLSVSLSYHAGGIKVDEMASNVGIGWSLFAGGAITRVMKGIPDETNTYGFWNSSNLPTNDYDGNTGNTPHLRRYNRINAGEEDSEIDVFNFNFNGVSGRFVFGKNNDFLMLTQQNLKVERSIQQVSGNARITSFTITDDKGIRYIFRDVERNTSNWIAYGPGKNADSAWYLTEIQSPSGLDKITFTYESSSYMYNITSSLSFGVAVVGANLPAAPGNASNLQQSVAGKRLKRIDFPTGEFINFTYNATQRTDLPGDYGLQKVQIVSQFGQKGIKLIQNYSLNRLTLSAVELTEGSSESVLGAYSFDYFTSYLLPERLSAKQDHWGFHNNNNTSSLIPAETFVNPIGGYYSLPGGNRSTDPQRVKSGALTKITYPTGGYTLFELESNMATDNRIGTNVNVGGLRAKKISDYDKNGSLLQSKEYEYVLEASTNSSGTLGILPVYSYGVFYDFETPLYPPPAPSYTFGQHNQVMRSASPITELSYFNGSAVLYRRVVEKRIVGANHEGYTVSYFSNFTDTPVVNFNTFPFVPPNFRSWNFGLLQKEEVFDKNGSLLRKTTNNYNQFADNYANNPVRHNNFISLSIAPVKYLYTGSNVGNPHDFWTSQGGVMFFISKDYLPVSGRSQLSKTTIEEFSGTNSFVKTIDYTYDNSYYMKLTEAVNDSNGGLIKTELTYPHQKVVLNQDPSGIYAEMVQRNITSPIVKADIYKGSTFLNSTRIEYYKPFTGVYVPQNVYEKNSTNPEYGTSVYSEYDNSGRLKKYKTSPNSSFNLLIWDTFGKYLMAKLENLSDSDKAYYSSFETNEKGGWTYTGSTLTTYNKTGRRAYSLSNGAVSATAIPASSANPYKVAFWARSTGASATVNISGQTESLTSNWMYIEKTITSTTINISGSNVIIDELRMHPLKSMMTTYTFEPISGITSSTDYRGQIFSYEYDPYYRLKSIKNVDGQIIELYDYNYSSGN